MMTAADCRPSLASATLTPFSRHMQHAHFERSPMEQVEDLKAFDDYAKLHTVLVQDMAAPSVQSSYAVSDGSPNPLVRHIYHAHLERSPMQQVEDLKAFDDYVKLHTVLLGDVAKPALTAVSGTC